MKEQKTNKWANREIREYERMVKRDAERAQKQEKENQEWIAYFVQKHGGVEE